MSYDAATAERLLRNALGGRPELSPEQYADLMLIAADADDAGAVVYTGAGLNRAAAAGWSWKQALQAERYDLGGGPGRTLDRSQWFAHCEHMRSLYATGAASVVGDAPPAKSGIRSIQMVGTLAAEDGTV